MSYFQLLKVLIRPNLNAQIGTTCVTLIAMKIANIVKNPLGLVS